MKEVCYLRFFSDGESASNGADDVAAQDVVNVDEVVDADHRQVQRKAEVAIAGCLKMFSTSSASSSSKLTKYVKLSLLEELWSSQ